MEAAGKGTVTSLASLFPVEEAQKAAKGVKDTIAEKEQELGRVQGFIADNNNLVNLVQKLPEDLYHDIMVPFGKAAFFPGRLIHTNEFLVLLGEGYYAERTSKQTIEILKRRGKSLDSQINSLEGMIKDLTAEASFFDATASEAAEGLVEIREDYVEEYSNEETTKPGPGERDVPSFAEAKKGKVTADDEEYARMMSRLDELEKEELAAEAGTDDNENEEPVADFDEISYQRSIDNNLRDSDDFQSRIPLEQTNKNSIINKFPGKHNHQEDITSELNFAGLAVQSEVREEKNLVQNVKKKDLGERDLIHPEADLVQATVKSKNQVQHQTLPPSLDSCKAFTGSIIKRDENVQTTSREQVSTSSEVQHQTSPPSFDSQMAFTGSIIEHAENLQAISKEQSSTSAQVSGSHPSRPVSRFKMQRR